jgi:hypothetical protein
MATTTLPKTGLNKQDEGDVDWETALNTGFDNLESRIERTSAGDPNGNVAGYWIGQPCWDSTNEKLYVCTTTGDAANAVWTLYLSGGGNYLGENGEVGADRTGDIFRVNESTLNSDVTIPAGENASCAGPLTIASGVTLTVNGNLTIV